MNEVDKETIALWRFGLAAPIINHSHGFSSDIEYAKSVTANPLTHPVTGVSRMYSANTVLFWAWSYTRGGLPSLIPQTRRDYRTSRRLDETTQEKIRELAIDPARLSNVQIRRQLIDSGIINSSVSQSTVDRFIKVLRIKDKSLPQIHHGKERKAFEFEHINQSWQADTTFLKKIGGKKVCLILIVDDASRMAVGYDLFYEDNAVNFLKVLKKAVSIYGKPSILYMDNGGTYRNKHLDWTCAQIGVEVVHTQPYDGAAKGKVERLNRTIKEQWLKMCDWDKFQTLEDAQQSLKSYFNSFYLIKPHSALKDRDGHNISPRERFLAEEQLIRKVPSDLLEKSFLFHVTRKVKTDSTITIENRSYDIPAEYIRDTIDIYYDPMDHNSVWFKPPDSKNRIPVSQTNKVENAHTVRKQYIELPGEDSED